MATAAYDDFRIDQSSVVDEEAFSFKARQFISVGDQNGTNFSSGQIIFDLAALASSDRFIDWSSSYLQVPVTMALTSGGVAAWTNEATNCFAMSMKNGWHNIIHSMSVQLSNQQVIDVTQYCQIPTNFKLLTEMSQQDCDVFGANMGWYPDDSDSIGWDATAALMGETNTFVSGGSVDGGAIPTAAKGVSAFSCNSGRVKRMMQTSACNVADPVVSRYVNPASLNAVQKNNCVLGTAALTWQLFLNIPMKFLHPLFEKCPLLKSSYWKLVINTNLPATFNATVSAAAPAVLSTVTVSTPNGVLPFQISPFSNAAGSCNRLTTAGAVSATCTIGNATQPSCRIFCAQYQFNPQSELQYVKTPIRRIVYDDFQCYIPTALQNIAAGGTVSMVQITPSQSKLRRLLIVPTTSTASNVVGTTAVAPWNSPFTSAPLTTAPYSFVSGLNVYLSGNPLFQNQVNYTYELFQDEMNGLGCYNGGGCMAMSSGCINQASWNSAYGYISINLCRKDAGLDNLNQSVAISFQNQSLVPMSYSCFLFYEREISLDVRQGILVI